ncbi:MAG: hypothetical protein WCL32_20525 [Planctomycetota bacterium]
MADSFKIQCPGCKAHIRLPVELAGTETVCPGCRQRMKIPDIKNTALPAQIVHEIAAPPPLPPASLIQSSPPAVTRSNPTGPTKSSSPFDFDSAEEVEDDEGEDDIDRPRRRRQEPHRGTAILVMGILGLLFF